MRDILLVAVILVVGGSFGIFMAKRFELPYFTRRRAEIEEVMNQRGSES